MTGPVKARCPDDHGAYAALPDGVLVVCGCGWHRKGRPSKRDAKRLLQQHRVLARGLPWTPPERKRAAVTS